jgi:hypothetical protein
MTKDYELYKENQYNCSWAEEQPDGSVIMTVAVVTREKFETGRCRVKNLGKPDEQELDVETGEVILAGHEDSVTPTDSTPAQP